MKPRIGVTSSVNIRDYESDDREVVMLPWNYPSMIEECGGIPLIIPEGGDPSSSLDALDGLIIAGGRDVDPSNYGQESEAETTDTRLTQDHWEIALINEAKRRGMPVLGICRGHQLIAVAHGGALHQHLPSTTPFESHGAWGGEWSNHEVELVEGTSLSTILNKRCMVNSAHHQGVSDPGTLTVNARSDDGLIEGLEDSESEFFLSVQWHPEALGQKQLISALVDASQNKSLA